MERINGEVGVKMINPPRSLTLIEGGPGRPVRARLSPLSFEKGSDLEGLIRPMLEALASVAGLESTYLTVFDWNRREQEVRFVFNAGEALVHQGHCIGLPDDVHLESFPGITRSPRTDVSAGPDSLVARHLGLKTFLSVPVIVQNHQLFGMLCGASRSEQKVTEPVVGFFESFAAIIGGHILTARVKSAEKRADLAEASLVTRARFVAEAEHRMKTPLAVLEGMALTLRDHDSELSDVDRKSFHESLVRQTRLLSDEVSAMLLAARADVCAQELDPSDVLLAPLVSELTQAFDGLDTPHHVVLDAPDDISAFVDRPAVAQIVGHLLDNAIKYSPEGGDIVVRLAEVEGIVSIDVIDQGMGVPSGIDIFEPFQRGDGEDRRSAGIGIGLHIVRSLAEAMGGSVELVAREGPGSTFRVLIPALAGDRS